MPNHAWSVLCRRSLLDRDDNSISLIEAIEELHVVKPEGDDIDNIPKPGNIQVHMQMVSLWSRGQNEKGQKVPLRLLLVAPSGKTTIDHGYEADLSNHVRARVRVNLNGIPITELGEHIFKVQSKKGKNWQTQAKVPLEIKFEKKKD